MFNLNHNNSATNNNDDIASHNDDSNNMDSIKDCGGKLSIEI